MRTLITCFVCALVLGVFAIPALYAADAPPDGLKMENTKNAVTFNHSAHKAEPCEACHHMAKDNPANIKKCSSAGCHDNFDKKDKSVHSYYQAIHGKGGTVHSCVSCHKEKAGDDKAKKKELAGCKKSVCHP